MKIAGRKNQGAYERARKTLFRLTTAERTSLEAKLAALPTVDAAFNALVSYQAQVGLVDPTLPQSVQEWVALIASSNLSLQVWMGRLSTTTYTKDDDGKWKANYQSPMHYFAKDLRKAITQFTFANREIRNVLVSEPYNPN